MQGPVLRARRTGTRAPNPLDSRGARIEARLGSFAMGIILIAVVMIGAGMADVLFRHLDSHRWAKAATDLLLMFSTLLLAFNALVHLWVRRSFQKSQINYASVGAGALETYFTRAPAVTILIPCQNEDETMLTRALMSAALQTFPQRRVVLLIDDPAVARALTRKLQQSLVEPADKFAQALREFRERLAQGPLDMHMEVRLLAELNLDAAEWYRRYAQRHPGDDHVDSHFVEHVLERLCNEHLTRAQRWQRCFVHGLTAPSAEKIIREFQRLDALFSAEITSFERTRYANLCHAPGRAKSLNSYIALTGKNFHERLEGGQRYLEEGDYSGTYFHIPDADYFLVLDADTYITPDCTAKLTHSMQQAGKEKIAITQIPGCPAPNAGVMLQRVAGALMDMRYVMQQGYAQHAAASWTGESGLIRTSALRELAHVHSEAALSVTRYFNDGYTGEGPGTTLDLLQRGWEVTNYPERLAWTASPSDPAALTARYRRWHDGAFMVLPRLFGYLLRRRAANGASGLAGVLRVHYQTATLTTNISLLIVLSLSSLSIPRAFYSAWLGAAVLAYALPLARDLVRAGYPWSDFLRAYAMKLLLIPVSLGGVITSLHKAWTHTKAWLQYRPKRRDRIDDNPVYHLAAYGLLVLWFVQAVIALTAGRWVHGLLVGINAAFLLYAVAGYIGFSVGLDSMQAALRRRRRSWRERHAAPGLVMEAGFSRDDAAEEETNNHDRDTDMDAFVSDAHGDSANQLRQEATRSRRVLVPEDELPRH